LRSASWWRYRRSAANGKRRFRSRRKQNARSRGLRRANAGDDLDSDSRCATRGHLLTAAIESRALAALEPHHAPAALGQRDHESVDLVLLASGTVADATDQHLLRFAPCKVENVRRDQRVDQDDVRRLQRAHRAQRDQLRIARAGAHQRHSAGVRGLPLGRVEKRVEVALRRFVCRMVHRASRK